MSRNGSANADSVLAAIAHLIAHHDANNPLHDVRDPAIKDSQSA